MSQRAKLPVVQIQEALLQALMTNDVVVVGGDTGCGKTTQVGMCKSTFWPVGIIYTRICIVPLTL